MQDALNTVKVYLKSIQRGGGGGRDFLAKV